MTSKLQVTLPKAIADLHNIRPGSEIQFESAIDCIRIVVGKSRIELPLEERLRLLKEARKRQQLFGQRNSALRGTQDVVQISGGVSCRAPPRQFRVATDDGE